MLPTTHQCIGKWISIIHRKSQVFMQAALDEFGLSPAEMFFLLNIPDAEINQKYMSDLLNMDEALAARVMGTLAEKGFITRQRAEADKRAYIIRLTDLGKTTQPGIRQYQADWLDRITLGLTAEEIRLLQKQLEILADNAINATKRS